MKRPIFKRKFLNTYYLKQYRQEANNNYQVWKKDDGYYVALGVISYEGNLYAEETIQYGNNFEGAKKMCDELRREYILIQAKKMKKQKKVY